MRRAVQALIALAALAAIGFGWVAAARNGPVEDVGAIGAFITIAVVFGQVAGWMIGRRRPDRWIGALVMAGGLTGVAGVARYGNLGNAVLAFAIVWLAAILVPVAVVLIELDAIGMRGKLLLAGAMLATTGTSLAIVAVAGHAHARRTWWFAESSSVASTTAKALFAGHALVVVVTLTAMIVVLVGRYSRTERVARPLVRPVLFAGIAWALAVGAVQIACLFDPQWAFNASGRNFTSAATLLFEVFPLLTLAAVLAAVVWAELIVPRLQRTPAGIVVRDRGGDADAHRLLARTLADPSVRILFCDRVDGSWLDAAGEPASVDSDDPERMITLVTRGGVVLGAVEHDAALASQPEAIELAVAGAGLALDNDRLLALARSRVEQAGRLAARLMAASDAVRDDLRRVLAAGPARQLAEVEAWLTDEAAIASITARLQHTAAEVRRISHGVFPAALVDGGLRSALLDAREVPARRFPPAVEVTAFLAANGDPTARLRSSGEALTIELAAAPRDPALLDRLDVLGGTIREATITIPLAG